MNSATIGDLTRLAISFRDERNWKQFHNAKDVALSLVLEAAELLEITQWKNGEELDAHLFSQREHVGQELSDILYWVLLLANDQNIDLSQAFRAKLQLNAEKYPVDKAKNNAEKYTRL